MNISRNGNDIHDWPYPNAKHHLKNWTRSKDRSKRYIGMCDTIKAICQILDRFHA